MPKVVRERLVLFGGFTGDGLAIEHDVSKQNRQARRERRCGVPSRERQHISRLVAAPIIAIEAALLGGLDEFDAELDGTAPSDAERL
jgi:hypothetical protein